MDSNQVDFLDPEFEAEMESFENLSDEEKDSLLDPLLDSFGVGGP